MRIDDPHFYTPQQTNPYAVMPTPVIGAPNTIVDTVNKTVTIPFPPYFSQNITEGSIFTVRRSTSDGSLAPQENSYDTAISGGDMAYSTAQGIAAEEIIIDGDGFVTPTTSPAPEEVVPGQIVDTVAIKVFEQSGSGSANVKVDNYIVQHSYELQFKVSQTINSPEALIVKVDGEIKNFGDDYFFDYASNYVTFTAVNSLSVGSIVSIFSIGFSGLNIVDLNYIIADGTSTVYLTRAHWVNPVSAIVYVGGLLNVYLTELIKTDETYDIANQIAIKFDIPPAAGAIIRYIIVEGENHTFATTTKEIIPLTGALSYAIETPIGNALPYESSMIVRVNDEILTGPSNSYFTIKGNQYNYLIDITKFKPYTVSIDDITVIADGTVLRLGYDYNVELVGINIKLIPAVAKKYSQKQLIVSIKQTSGYKCTPSSSGSTITLSQEYTGTMEIFSSYKNDSLGIKTSSLTINKSLALTPESIEYYNYSNVIGGIMQLDNPIINDHYVWVIKNGKLLTPSIDYKLNENKTSITLQTLPNNADNFTLMTYPSNVIKQSIAYMQFKDMLNRTHYKRLSLKKQTTLSQPLMFNDTIIYLEDGTNFSVPNPDIQRPGIIEIKGERIEYYEINGNQLSKIRRGTLGTGIPTEHKVGSYVQDIGNSETIPYVDESVIIQIISDGTNIINVPFIPSKSSTTREYSPGYISKIPSGYGQCDDIEVFVGGYNESSIWGSGVDYVAGNIVIVGSYTYQCITTHTSSSRFKADYDKWKFFIGNIRLKKSSYKVHDVNVHQESPEGDVQMDADFSVDGINKQIWLTNTLAYGTHVTVVKRGGVIWDSVVNIFDDETPIGQFINAEQGVWYTPMRK